MYFILYVLYTLLALISFIILTIAIYYYYQFFTAKFYLYKLPMVPQVPILGAALRYPNTCVLYRNIIEFPKRYGRTYWGMLGLMPLLFTSDPNLLEIILSSTKHINKPALYKILQDIGADNGLLTGNGDIWRSQRKLLTPTFHFKILEQFMKIFNKHADGFVKTLEKETLKQSTNVRDFTPTWALNQVTETVMGLTPEENQENNEMYLKKGKELLRIAMERVIRPLEYIDFTFRFTSNYKRTCKLANEIDEYIRQVIRRKEREFSLGQLSKNKPEDGIRQKIVSLDLLMEYSRYENKLSESDLVAQVQTILFTGYDTSSGTIAFALHNLAENCEAQERAYEEVKGVLGDDQEITIPHLQEMKYLEMILKESIRTFSNVPMIARELKEDVKWGDVTLPKGLTVIPSMSALHRDPEFYPEPDQFIPERFSPENSGTRHPYAYIPFSAGPRNCIGQRYAMLATKVALAKLVYAYKFESVGHKPILAAEVALIPKNGIIVRISKRQH